MERELPPPNQQRNKSEGVAFALLLALRLAWNLGFIIAIPAFAFGFGGAYLDKQLGTSPLFMLIGLAIALTLSSIGVKRRITSILGKSS